MARTAALLGRRAHGRKRLPPLLFFTDPGRTPDPAAAAARLPRGSAIVFRAFGAPDAAAQGEALRCLARQSRLILLVGADDRLAARIGADGVHLPERQAHRARRLKALHPRWLVTVAAHSAIAARRAFLSGADAVVVSTVFPSASPSAGAPMGPIRLARLARGAGGPVYALGGVNDQTARRLKDVGLVGLAAVEALRT